VGASGRAVLHSLCNVHLWARKNPEVNHCNDTNLGETRQRTARILIGAATQRQHEMLERRAIVISPSTVQWAGACGYSQGAIEWSGHFFVRQWRTPRRNRHRTPPTTTPQCTARKCTPVHVVEVDRVLYMQYHVKVRLMV
jgi:hypothetical protein